MEAKVVWIIQQSRKYSNEEDTETVITVATEETCVQPYMVCYHGDTFL